jgi:hypothetical protein
MILNDISRPALLLASLLLTAACSKAAPGQDPANDVENARRNAEAVQRAVAAALDRAALAALDKAEFRDADGKWADAGARQIDALRYTFRSSAAPITLANAALFKSN